MKRLLDSINKPADLKKFPVKKLPALAEEVVVAPPKTGSPFWDILGYVLGIVLVPIMGIVVKLLYEWQAKLSAEKGKADLDFKEKLKLLPRQSMVTL